MTELEELERHAVERVEHALAEGYWPGVRLWAYKLCQSRIGAAFDRARDRQEGHDGEKK